MAKIDLRYLGNATFTINMDGVQILTDPFLTQFVVFLKRHSMPIKPQWVTSTKLIIISHGHLDHFHPPSLKLLNRHTQCLVAPGLKNKLLNLGFTKVVELPVGKTFNFENLKITAVFAKHIASFFPFSHPVSECIGFVIKGTKTVYFPGDTDFYPEMDKLAFLKIYLCLIPIWGWAMDASGLHLDPLKAARALKLIQPKIAIPYHWGTFLPITFKPFFSRFLLLPANQFSTHADRLAPHVKTIILPPGESLTLKS